MTETLKAEECPTCPISQKKTEEKAMDNPQKIVRKCVPCMAESLKQLIRQFTNDPHTLEQINKLPDCATGEILELCGKTGKRQAGPYARFIGECMSKKPIKGKPFGTAGQYMKECSLAWRKEHAKGS